MIALAEEHTTTKPRRRPGAKAPQRKDGKDAMKLKKNLSLSVDAAQRLSVHATMMGVSDSDLVERLIREHLRRFVVSDRGGLDTGEDRQSSAA